MLRTTGQARRQILRWRSQNQIEILVAYDAVHMGQEQVTSERQQYGEEFHHHSRADKNRWREELEQRFPGAIAGVLSCYDRVLLQGTLPGVCFAGGMEKFLRTQGILLKDYTQWALPLAGQLKACAASLAAEAGISIEFLCKKVRKENLVQEVLAQRGNHPGLVCVFSALERCDTYRLHKNRDGRWGLRPDSGKCLHYYFYFMDPRWGLCFLRVPTWAPFRVQFYLNGHNWLAGLLEREKIGYRLLDNAFLHIADWQRAQEIADRMRIEELHRDMDRWVAYFCPMLAAFGWRYHWSVNQAEYATDVTFHSQKTLESIYDPLIRLAIHTIRVEHVATFLGKKLNTNFQNEAGNRFDVRLQGTRIKHRMGPVSIQMYDKFRLVLRMETTVNDLTFFQHYREVEQRDGQRVRKWAEMKKNIYSLPILQERLLAANWRYLQFLCALADPTVDLRPLHRITQPVQSSQRSYRGFNFFLADDRSLFETLLRGEFAIRGFANKDLRRYLPGKSSGQLSRLIKCLRLHGMVQKIPRSYRYRLSSLGLGATTLACKLKDLVILPELAKFAHP